MKKLTFIYVFILTAFLSSFSYGYDERPNIVDILSDGSGYTDPDSFVIDWVCELTFEARRTRLPYQQPLISELLDGKMV